jgi:hypothetical protein
MVKFDVDFSCFPNHFRAPSDKLRGLVMLERIVELQRQGILVLKENESNFDVGFLATNPSPAWPPIPSNSSLST